jgi:chemotaxis regulatin CheY-phosphate phosphatase CheZ
MRVHFLIGLLFTVVALEEKAKERVFLFKDKCSLCHPLEKVLEKTEYIATDWQAVVDNMMEEQDCREKVSPREAEKIKEFLSQEEWRKEVSNE